MAMSLIFCIAMIVSAVWVLYTGFLEDIFSLIPIGAVWTVVSAFALWFAIGQMNEIEEKAAICNPTVQICEENEK